MLDSDTPTAESLTVELKSDQKRLPDKDLVLAAVCLANTDGGCIYLGVEDDGRPTGLHPDHRDLNGLAAMIANRTIPPLSVRAVMMESAEQKIARIEVPRSTRLVATSDGTLQRRRLLADGKPQRVPFLPHEFASRASDLRLSDYSALPIAGADLDTLDPAERRRLRQAIEPYRGDRSLLGLDDAELDGALGLTRTESGRHVPSGLCGASRRAPVCTQSGWRDHVAHRLFLVQFPAMARGGLASDRAAGGLRRSGGWCPGQCDGRDSRVLSGEARPIGSPETSEVTHERHRFRRAQEPS